MKAKKKHNCLARTIVNVRNWAFMLFLAWAQIMIIYNAHFFTEDPDCSFFGWRMLVTFESMTIFSVGCYWVNDWAEKNS